MVARARARYELVADDRTGPAFASTRASMDSTRRAALRLGGQLAALAGAGAFLAVARNTLQTADELGKLSKQFSVSVETMSAYRGVLELTGVSQRVFVNSLRQVQKAGFDAANGSAEQVRAFRLLNIRVEEFNKLDAEGQLQAVTEGLRRMGKSTQQAAVAAQILGFRNTEWLRVANLTREEVEKLVTQQFELNRVWTTEQAAAAEAANDSLNLVKQSSTALSEQLTLALAPAISTIADAFRTIALPVLEIVRRQVNRITDLMGALGATIAFLFKGQFSEAFEAAKLGVTDLVDSVVRDVKEFAADPLGFSNPAVQANIRRNAEKIRADVDKVFGGGDSGTGLLEEDFKKIQAFINQLRASLESATQQERGSAAEIDTTLQSLSGSIQQSQNPLLRKLDGLEKVLKQRELLRVMTEVRDILQNDQGGGAAVFG